MLVKHSEGQPKDKTLTYYMYFLDVHIFYSILYDYIGSL